MQGELLREKTSKKQTSVNLLGIRNPHIRVARLEVSTNAKGVYAGFGKSALRVGDELWEITVCLVVQVYANAPLISRMCRQGCIRARFARQDCLVMFEEMSFRDGNVLFWGKVVSDEV